MAIIDTFSKRRRKLEVQGHCDVYRYDEIPSQLRVQVIHLWVSTIGRYQENPYPHNPACNIWWKEIHDALAREEGVFFLGQAQFEDPFVQCQRFLLNGTSDNALDIIELSFRVIDSLVRNNPSDGRETRGITESADSAIDELNCRFREHGIGYQYEAGILIRFDSQYLHAEAVKPAIILLRASDFKGALDEFLVAHEHYRHQRYKEAISEALKALESTLKTICDRRKWEYPQRATAKPLFDIVCAKGLIPSDMLSHFGGLRAALEAGVPTMRNRLSGHGQGENAVIVPHYIAGFALHLAAANIVFLIEAHKAMQ